MDILDPKDHGEAVALFRSEVVGALTRLELPRGELAARLEVLSQQRFRPPGATATRTFAVPTLERWYRRYKRSASPRYVPSPGPTKERRERSRPTSRSSSARCDAKTPAPPPS